MNQYLITKIYVDKNDDIYTYPKLYQNQIAARVYYLSLIDELKAQVSFLYSVPFEEFAIEEFGDIIETEFSYSFKDFEGKRNIKIEFKII